MEILLALFCEGEDTFKSSVAKESIIFISVFENADLKAVNIHFARNG